MDEETVKLLTEARLQENREIFVQNKIGINEIADIKDEQLRVLIGPIGDQIRFKKAVDVHNAKVASENHEEPCLDMRDDLSQFGRVIAVFVRQETLLLSYQSVRTLGFVEHRHSFDALTSPENPK